MPYPDRIDVAPDVYAVRVHIHYVLRFPFSIAANERVKSAISGHYFAAGGGWMMDVSRHDAVKRVLEDIDRIIGPRAVIAVSAATEKPQRILVADGSVTPGARLQTKKGEVIVDRLGAPFIGEAKLAKWGRPDLVGKMVRYAYQSPVVEPARPEPDEMPSP